MPWSVLSHLPFASHLGGMAFIRPPHGVTDGATSERTPETVAAVKC
jgi:hypothetical protein